MTEFGAAISGSAARSKVIEEKKYTEDEALNNAIVHDDDLKKLEASLLREGFSTATAMGMVFQMGKAKHDSIQNDRSVNENRQRLNDRLKLVGLKEKRVIPGDGNCQFSAVSDQLFDTIDKSTYIRQTAVDWLRRSRDFELPNGAVLWNFAYDQTWDEFCNELARPGIWGNHLTLVAISEIFGVRIRIISSVKGDNFTTEVNPSKLKSAKIVWLSHFAEFHYSSLTPISK